MSHAAERLATARDLQELPDDVPAEVIGGVVVEKAAPSAEHADAQAGLTALLRTRFHRPGGDGTASGWWLLTEVEIELESFEVYRPDIAGWRRSLHSERPRGRPVAARPDWVCEILSPSNAKNDLVDKFRVFQRSGVPFYWIVDPEREILTVYRLQNGLYVVAQQATRGEIVRAEPFDAVSLRVGLLFGEDDEGPLDPTSG